MREITQRDRENARRLASLWSSRKKELGLTQTKAAERLGFKSQGTVSQYLNCHIALNAETVLKFANLLRCEPGQIDPALGGLRSAKLPDSTEVVVRGTLSGAGKPTTANVEVRYSYMSHRCYALEVDSDQYRGFARKGSRLVVSEVEEPAPDDDVLITLRDGVQVLAIYQGGDNDTLKVTDMLTGLDDSYALTIVEKVEPIVEIVKPTRRRAVKIHAVK